ncbi:MAG: imidazole glycerol phosphate synthase subunit HisH [Beijerinckiaceae bacterium]
MNIALIDYGAGNLHSAAKALERAMTDAAISGSVTITAKARDIAAADRIVLPGDGAYADCMTQLRAAPEMVETLEKRVRNDGVPFLGICVGMQLLATQGTEHGLTQGLGWLPGSVERIAPQDPALKVPHMGWNTLDVFSPHPLLAGIRLGPQGLHAYFLHAYHLIADDPADVIAQAEYGSMVTAIIARGNIAGVQFHPEKSQTLGLALLGNFLRWTP